MVYSKHERSVHCFGSYFVYNGQANITSLVGSSLGKNEGGAGVCLQPTAPGSPWMQEQSRPLGEIGTGEPSDHPFFRGIRNFRKFITAISRSSWNFPW